MLSGHGNEVAHLDLIIGRRGSQAESAFANAQSRRRSTPASGPSDLWRLASWTARPRAAVPRRPCADRRTVRRDQTRPTEIKVGDLTAAGSVSQEGQRLGA
ncbi:MAG: formaldehyde-activating enzyme [Rhizobacter sp.]|nr:formaldehyde-activating enzyme [Rhizobacter sp.]